MHRFIFIILHFLFIAFNSSAQNTNIKTQVLVVNGGTGGMAAGLQAARSGATTLIVEQTNWLGGMLTAAGVSCTDGNDAFKSGIWQAFQEALKIHYQRKYLNTGWVSNTCFEPHVGDSIFKSWVKKEANLSVKYNWYFHKVLKKENKIIGVEFVNKKNEKLTVYATIIIDATDLGDVFANAGCAYDLGTEDSSQSHEKIAPGKTKIIQDITWAAVLQDFGPNADKTITKPVDYDPLHYYCSTLNAPCNGIPYNGDTKKVLNYGKLPVTNSGSKYMLNWPVHGNDYYLDVVELNPLEREKQYVKAKQQTLGFIYFLQTELGMKQIGLSDEFGSSDQLALIPYHREGRRIKGLVRFNIEHLSNPFQFHLYKTGIAVGDYPVDHHHAQYPGKVPPIPFPQIPSYNIPMGAVISPTIDNLLICDKGISVSNIVNGTTRLQPVVLLTGQAVGIMAAECIHQHIQPKQIDIRSIQNALLNNNCYIMPFCDIDPTDPAWKSVQIMGALGLMKGHGVSEGWSNKTYYYPDSLMKEKEFIKNVNDLFQQKIVPETTDELSYITDKKLQHITNQINNYLASEHKIKIKQQVKVDATSVEKIISKKEIAVLFLKEVNTDVFKINFSGDLLIR
jgi:hypothetical protein